MVPVLGLPAPVVGQAALMQDLICQAEVTLVGRIKSLTETWFVVEPVEILAGVFTGESTVGFWPAKYGLYRVASLDCASCPSLRYPGSPEVARGQPEVGDTVLCFLDSVESGGYELADEQWGLRQVCLEELAGVSAVLRQAADVPWALRVQEAASPEELEVLLGMLRYDTTRSDGLAILLRPQGTSWLNVYRHSSPLFRKPGFMEIATDRQLREISRLVFLARVPSGTLLKIVDLLPELDLPVVEQLGRVFAELKNRLQFSGAQEECQSVGTIVSYAANGLVETLVRKGVARWEDVGLLSSALQEPLNQNGRSDPLDVPAIVAVLDSIIQSIDEWSAGHESAVIPVETAADH